MRNRLTWRNDRTAARTKTADPYVMNQDPQDPSPVDYETGNPSAWAEDLHPTNWKDGYLPRNELGLGQMDDKTFDHAGDGEWGEESYDNVTASESDVKSRVEEKVAARRAERIAAEEKAKVASQISERADLAIRVATLMLGDNAPESMLKDQSWELMGLPNAHLAQMLERYEKVAEEHEMEEAGEDDESKEAAEMEEAGEDDESKEAAEMEEVDEEMMDKEASRLAQIMKSAEEMEEDEKEASPVFRIKEKKKGMKCAKLIKAAKTAGYKLAEEMDDEMEEEMEKEATTFLAGLKKLAQKASSKQGKLAARILKAMDEEEEMDEDMEKSAGSLFVAAYSSRFAAEEEDMEEAMEDGDHKEASDLDFELGSMDETDVTAADQEVLAQLFQTESVESGNEAKTASSTPKAKKGVSKLASATTTGSTDGEFDLSNLWQRAPDVSDVFGN